MITSARGAALRLVLFAAAMVVVLLAVITAIQRPVSGDTNARDGLFTDANGLKVGDDVRMFGVQVGKVEGIDLDGTQARVRFTLRTDSHLYDNSKLAIRYQNLTGQRYVDLQQDPKPGAELPKGTTVTADHTVPSFDVTSLFNGLQPVLATLSPESLNQLTTSLLAVIEGDGTGIGPAMEAIGKLGSYVGDRQQVIATLVHNMSIAADKIGGRSPQLVTFLGNVTQVFTALRENVVGLIDFALTAPPVLDPANRLLATLGLTEKTNPDIDHILKLLIPDPQMVVDVLARLPALLSALDNSIPSNGPGAKPVCSKGNADVPGALQVLLAGQRVSICKG
ncbi:MlaD family protein [Nocardia callitridis]|uniref:MCE family protein n=1 Tax=Nocardia callitridis TaxID=648753 RepID=A0ABP9KKC6_9NOCA